MLRLYPGDRFVFKEKGSDSVTKTYVNNLSDTAVVTQNDTVPFHRIERIYFRQRTFYNRVGRGLVVAGAGLFLVDQFNTVVIQGDDPSLSDYVTPISIATVVAGLPLMLAKKKSQKLKTGYRLVMVQEGSPFYRRAPRESPVSGN